MIIVPKEKPVIENLNSYYVDMARMFTHFQKEISAGAVHCKSRLAEGVVFFDKDEVLSGSFEDRTGKLDGMPAVEKLKQAATQESFVINIYEIDLEMIHFWANIPLAEIMYKDLSTEFTDFDALIAKMSEQKLTGYIDACGISEKDSGILFMRGGVIIGGSYAWGEGELSRSEESQKLLMQKIKESGGVFNVSRIHFAKPAKEKTPEPQPGRQAAVPVEPRPAPAAAPAPSRPAASGAKENRGEILMVLQELLNTMEVLVESNKKIKRDFGSLLKKKFMEKADEGDEFMFLDPFAAEFEYFDKRISFVGCAGDKELVNGVVTSLRELADELGIRTQLREKASGWLSRNSALLKRLGVDL
jgi:hypothetical protein